MSDSGDDNSETMENEFFFKSISVRSNSTSTNARAKLATKGKKKRQAVKTPLFDDDSRQFFVFVEFFEHEILS